VTLGSIAAALLHDIAQPLAVAEVNATRLAEVAAAGPILLEFLARHGNELTEGQAEGLRYLADESGEIAADLLTGLSHMKGLLDQIRQLARRPAATDSRRTDPAAVLRFVAGACRSLAVRSGTHLTFENAGEMPPVAMTMSELTQVAMNVVSNGIQAVEKTVEGRVVVTARAGAEGLLLTVEDNGPGIPAALMEKIGRPFFSTRAEGTGLGIAQCRRIVGGVGGTFRLESAEGKGTCVFVRVPWAPP
jgi:signal transduction histidine kinase